MNKWKPQISEKYYLIELPEVEVSSELWTDSSWDNMAYNIGNCFKTKEEATKMLNAIKQLLASGVIEQVKEVKLPRKFAPGDYVWYKEASTPAIVDTVVCGDDDGGANYVIKYWDADNQQYAFIQEPEYQLAKGYFIPFSESTFNKNLIGAPVIDRKSGSVFLLTAFITSKYRFPVSSLCMGEGSYINRMEANYKEPLVVVNGECITLTGLYEHYDINGFPCGEFHTYLEKKN